MNKTCTACNAIKDVADFVSRTKVYDWCKDCRRLLMRRALPPVEKKDFKTKNDHLKHLREYQPPRTLKPETVKIVRSMYAKGSGVTAIARGMNIGRTTVSDIVNNKTYKWVE